MTRGWSDEQVEAAKADLRRHKVTRHPDAQECAVCGDVGHDLAGHTVRVVCAALDAAGGGRVRELEAEAAAMRSLFGDLWNYMEGLHDHWKDEPTAPLIEADVKRAHDFWMPNHPLPGSASSEEPRADG